MLISRTVRDITLPSIHFVSVYTPLAEVDRLMEEEQLEYIPVMAGDDLVGIMSQNEIRYFFFVDSVLEDDFGSNEAFTSSFQLKDMLFAKLVCVDIDQSIYEAAELMYKYRFNVLPVLSGEKLVGMVTSQSLIKFLVDNVASFDNYN